MNVFVVSYQQIYYSREYAGGLIFLLLLALCFMAHLNLMMMRLKMVWGPADYLAFIKMWFSIVIIQHNLMG